MPVTPPGGRGRLRSAISEPELSIVRALNCANATLVSAIEVGDTGVLAGALSGEALAYWEEESARLQGRYQRAIPTRALVSSVTIDGDTAAVETDEDWTLITTSGSRTTCSYRESYVISKDRRCLADS